MAGESADRARMVSHPGDCSGDTQRMFHFSFYVQTCHLVTGHPPPRTRLLCSPETARYISAKCSPSQPKMTPSVHAHLGMSHSVDLWRVGPPSLLALHLASILRAHRKWGGEGGEGYCRTSVGCLAKITS